MTSFLGKRGRDSADFDELERYPKLWKTWAPNPCEIPSVVFPQVAVMQDVWVPRMADTPRAPERFNPRVLPRADTPRASVGFNWWDSPPMYTSQAPESHIPLVHPRAETARPQESQYRPAQIPASDPSCYKSKYADEPYVPRRRRGWELREIAVKKFKEALPALAVVATLVGWAGVLLSRH